MKRCFLAPSPGEGTRKIALPSRGVELCSVCMEPGIPDVKQLTRAQAEWTRRWHEQDPEPPAAGFLGLVQENHWQNFSLWHEEDQARREDCGPEHVYRAKRAIDRHNQLRNNAMERIDAALLEVLEPAPEAPLNSETPGMMIDRLSILALKEYHMREETERAEASPEHRESCARKLAVIHTQRADLAGILSRFFDEICAGTRGFKVYFQFKMYNDPALNPQLYRRGEAGEGARS